jgi:hypothetical protein
MARAHAPDDLEAREPPLGLGTHALPTNWRQGGEELMVLTVGQGMQARTPRIAPCDLPGVLVDGNVLEIDAHTRSRGQPLEIEGQAVTDVHQGSHPRRAQELTKLNAWSRGEMTPGSTATEGPAHEQELAGAGLVASGGAAGLAEASEGRDGEPEGPGRAR